MKPENTLAAILEKQYSPEVFSSESASRSGSMVIDVPNLFLAAANDQTSAMPFETISSSGIYMISADELTKTKVRTVEMLFETKKRIVIGPISSWP